MSDPLLTVGLTPSRGWINDPYGVTYRPEDGRYHLFFQHVPDSLTWQPRLSWGHAVSTDLRTWTELPAAIGPDADDTGCWSGCVADGRIFYTAVSGHDPDRHQVARIRSATPLDSGWVAWRKHDLDLDVPAGLRVFRDPFVLRDGAGWRMLVGAGLAGGAGEGDGAVVSFTSSDLERWDYAGVLARRSSEDRSGSWTGSAWECPQLVEVDGRWALLVSVWSGGSTHHLAYAFGRWEGPRFVPGAWRTLADGPPYAATTFRDAHDRLVTMCWLRGVEDRDAGWVGALSAPCLVTREGDRLVLTAWSG